MVWSRSARSSPGCRADGRGLIVERTTGGGWAGSASRGVRTVGFERGDLGLLEGPEVPQSFGCRVSRRGGAAGQHGAGLWPVARLSPPPRRAMERPAHFPVLGGSAGSSRFASCQRGRERAGRGVGAAERVPEPVPSPARDPGPPAPPTPDSEALVARSAPHSPARHPPPLALWPVGRAPETPSDPGWWQTGGQARVAASSPCPRNATPAAASRCTSWSGTTTTGSWRRSCGAR